jgi:DNA-directed RNA polymerase beta' subunit
MLGIGQSAVLASNPVMIGNDTHSETERLLVDNDRLIILNLLKVQSGRLRKFSDSSGDEMNVHVAQSPEANAEIQNLSTVKHNLVTGQSSKMNICLVQDGVLGAFLMTKKDAKPLTQAQFFQCTMRLTLYGTTFEERYKLIKTKLSNACSGRGLVSLILPHDFWYKRKVGKEPSEPWLVIENGVIVRGCLSKASIGSSHHCIPHYIYNEYGADVALTFIDNLQFLANEWLSIRSFSIGLRDCLPTSDTLTHKVQDTIKKCFLEAETIIKRTRNADIRESRINAALGKAKDIGLKIARNAMRPENNFISTVTGGSKGDFFNIAQITGLLGQQNIRGKRLPLFLHRKSIPHYPDVITSPSERYESRGFIASSFIKGLNPREFFFHACSGREGMSDTAVGTAVSGYIQRRIVKLQEDMRVNYDGSVRDETKRIFQLQYGANGFDCTKTLKVGGQQSFMNLNRLANRLNREENLE